MRSRWSQRSCCSGSFPLVELPSAAALAQVNERLREEIAAHEKTLSSLEKLVEERTSELKSANATLAVQTREAIHRSSNLLAVVSSLAEQTAKDAERTDEFLRIFRGRVQALADATRSIEKSDRSSTELDRVVDARLAHLEEAYGERIAYAGPPVTINPEAAQQLSLALHELATNTQKYGLGASDRVHVEVSWNTAAGLFELVWREYGAPAPVGDEQAGAEGFGTKLLTRVVPMMLRGQATRTSSRDGLVYRLSAPLAAIAADEKAGDSDRLAARIVDESFGLD